MGASGSFSALVDDFLLSLKAEKSVSPHTVLNYEIDLRHWLKFLFEKSSAQFSLNRLCDFKILREFLAQEMQQYERSTVNRRLSCIKGFLKFLYREGHIEKNIGELVSLPKVEEKIPQILKPEQINRFIDALPTGSLREKRNRAIFELLYSTGIRISELVAINYDDIELRNGSVRVMGKGNKERAVPLGRHCRIALKDYIDSVPSIQKTGPKAPIFMNASGGRITVRAIQKILKGLAVETLGLEASFVSPHTFRHSAASHLLANGAGLREIQELMGHRSLVTTKKYTQVDIQQLKAAYKASHPKERGKK